MYKLLWTSFFHRKAKKFFKQHSDLTDKFEETICILENDPYDNRLKTHSLEGKMNGKYSLNLTFAFRIIRVY